MSVNEDWDVEQHKVEYESDEHWELRRKFLVAHKDKFAEDVLVCLAQVFVNVELLGCRYPQETMDLVEELARDVAAEYREKQKKKLQRTFVEASEAASSKVKGHAAKASTVPERSVPHTSNHTSNIDNFIRRPNKRKAPGINEHQACSHNVQLEAKKAKTSPPTPTKEPMSSAFNCDHRSSERLDSEEGPAETVQTKEGASCEEQNFYRNIVLWEKPGSNAQSILQVSASVSGMPLIWTYNMTEGGWECYLDIGSHRLGCSTNFNKKEARKEAATIALEKLQKRCYTVKVKEDLGTNSDVTVTTDEFKHSTADNDGKVDSFQSNCIGNKLMKMMGWSGGGLGKSEQGLMEPMSAVISSQISRKGFGLKTNSHKGHEKANVEIKSKCRKLFKDLLQSDNYLANDIVFLDFSKEDRALIHQLARSIGLKSRSYGKDQRRLIVSRKVNIRNFVEKLNSLGGVTEKYELVKPADETLPSLPTSTDV
ncbi:PREDICTED: NF-kappa-B-repressing factor [Vollenhovia emeryi]|uniref:NF-kappa-B-repressing factor n=1 Tax=Vollenhovia emeryi TaxID=411798 RepID=UPI0005F3EF66|nr:PREDICTED: NF-kappa-B-repressing factor [Vollenhovia emeryi]